MGEQDRNMVRVRCEVRICAIAVGAEPRCAARQQRVIGYAYTQRARTFQTNKYITWPRRRQA